MGFILICAIIYAIIDTIQEEMGYKPKKRKRSTGLYIGAVLLGAWLGLCDYAKKGKYNAKKGKYNAIKM